MIINGANRMIRTTVILDLLKKKLGSDYQIAKAFGVEDKSYVSKIRKRGIILNDEFGLIAAEILDFPEEAILLSLAAERALNSEKYKQLEMIANRNTPAAVETAAAELEQNQKTGTK